MAMELQKQKLAGLPQKSLEKSPPGAAAKQRLDSSSSTIVTSGPTEGNAARAEEPGKEGEEAKEGKEIPLSPSSSVPVSDLQKKLRRAERFGVPVQLSEEEKRNSRAERFGTSGTTYSPGEAKKMEEQKRKARAERFGLPSQSIGDEEAKKKARLARFAQGLKADPLEEEKRKSRAIRFGQASSGSQSETNGKVNSEQKTDAVGKPGAGT